MKKKILITGGAGFIGSNLTSFLLKKNFSVNILDNLSYGKKKNLNSKAKFFFGDIRNKKDLIKASKNCFAIIHLAAISALQKTIVNPEECMSNNVVGTTNVIEVCIINKIKLIFASTCAVYPVNKKKKFHELDYKNYDTPYAISKITSENLINFYFRQNILKGVILRFFNVYGKNQNYDSIYSAVIARFIYQAKNKKPLTINNGGSQKRDFIYVEDVCEAILKSLKYDKNDVFNIGTGVAISIKKLSKIIMAKFKFYKQLNKRSNKFDASYSCANINKAITKLNFQPKNTINEGLIKIFNDK